jgi:hypothetical protein
VSYHASDEEVQLRAMPDCLYQAVKEEHHPPPPNYSSLPRGSCRVSHSELQRHLNTLSNWPRRWQWLSKQKKRMNKVQFPIKLAHS